VAAFDVQSFNVSRQSVRLFSASASSKTPDWVYNKIRASGSSEVVEKSQCIIRMQSFEDDALIDDTLRLSQEVDHEEMKHHRTKEEISESSESAFEEFGEARGNPEI